LQYFNPFGFRPLLHGLETSPKPCIYFDPIPKHLNNSVGVHLIFVLQLTHQMNPPKLRVQQLAHKRYPSNKGPIDEFSYGGGTEENADT